MTEPVIVITLHFLAIFAYFLHMNFKLNLSSSREKNFLIFLFRLHYMYILWDNWHIYNSEPSSLRTRVLSTFQVLFCVFQGFSSFPHIDFKHFTASLPLSILSFFISTVNMLFYCIVKHILFFSIKTTSFCMLTFYILFPCKLCYCLY